MKRRLVVALWLGSFGVAALVGARQATAASSSLPLPAQPAAQSCQSAGGFCSGIHNCLADGGHIVSLPGCSGVAIACCMF